MKIGFIRSLQPCRASRASLKALKFLKPMPPSGLEFRCNHVVSTSPENISVLQSPFHQKFLTMKSNLSKIILGSRKKAIVGMTWTTALIRIPFPAWERSFYFHPCGFFIAFSIRNVKASDVETPTRNSHYAIFLALKLPKMYTPVHVHIVIDTYRPPLSFIVHHCL